VNAFLGELRWRPAGERRSASLGTGVGGAIALDGAVHQCAHGAAGRSGTPGLQRPGVHLRATGIWRRSPPAPRSPAAYRAATDPMPLPDRGSGEGRETAALDVFGRGPATALAASVASRCSISAWS
jgi:glucokinase